MKGPVGQGLLAALGLRPIRRLYYTTSQEVVMGVFLWWLAEVEWLLRQIETFVAG